MRRAGHERTASCETTTSAPPTNSTRASVIVPRHFPNGSTSTVDVPATELLLSPGGNAAKAKAGNNRADRRRQIDVTIRQRIESRLPGRVRNLNVRLLGNTVVLEGQCATYYTKQLAQHAALGVLEDEQLDNAIVVSVPR